LPNFNPRRKTITSYTELYDGDHSSSDHNDGQPKWGDAPDKNDEAEREELLLYVQRNSRMTFAGIMPKNLLSAEHIQKLVREKKRIL
jgi:hypothetical protein